LLQGDIIKVAFKEDEAVIARPPAMPLRNPTIDCQIIIKDTAALSLLEEEEIQKIEEVAGLRDGWKDKEVEREVYAPLHESAGAAHERFHR